MADAIDPTVPQSGTHNITKDKLKTFLPKGSSHQVTDEILSMITGMEDDTGLLQDYMEESVLSHMHVFKTMKKVDLKDYVNAIKYCNLKQNMSNKKAWEITFPTVYTRLSEKIANGEKAGSIDANVYMYDKSDIVTKISAEMMISAHIQYAPMFHASVRKQFELMNGKAAGGMNVSAHVQHLAAKELREITQMPEDNSIELKIGPTDEAKKSQDKLFDQMNTLALQQQQLLAEGHDITKVQKLNIKMTVEEDIEDAEYE
jgi:hypothetical protein